MNVFVGRLVGCFCRTDLIVKKLILPVKYGWFLSDEYTCIQLSRFTLKERIWKGRDHDVASLPHKKGKILDITSTRNIWIIQ